jgi:hypothetical protein
VVAEVALSLVLLLGAALMIESLAILQRGDPGSDPHGVLTLLLGLPQQKYPEPRQQSAFFDRVLTRLRTLPGVEAAATVDWPPCSSPGRTSRSPSRAGRRAPSRSSPRWRCA